MLVATALCAVLGRGVPSDVKRPTGRGYNIYEMAFITRLKSGVSKQEATVAQQQRRIEVLTTQLQEQAAQFQKVNAKLEMIQHASHKVKNQFAASTASLQTQ